MPPGFPSHISFGFQLDAADDQLMYHPEMRTGNQAKEHLHFTDLKGGNNGASSNIKMDLMWKQWQTIQHKNCQIYNRLAQAKKMKKHHHRRGK